MAEARYKSGLDDFINVLQTEAALYLAETQLAESDGLLDQDLVSLKRRWAVGGRNLSDSAALALISQVSHLSRLSPLVQAAF